MKHKYCVCQWELHICHGPSRTKTRFLPRTKFKDELWFPTNRRFKMFFSRNQGIDIVYPNGNYPFVSAHRKKILDSYHEWSSSCFLMKNFDSEKNEVFKNFFCETKAWILCIPIETTHLSRFIVKKTKFLPRTKVVPFWRRIFIPNQSKGWNVFLRNQGINIVHLNENYRFVLAHRERKLDSVHEWSLSRFKDEHWFPINWKVKIFFRKTKASISCVLMGTTNLSWAVKKRN